MTEETFYDSTNIVVCGYGPTGAMVSALLSQFSVPHVVLERDVEVNADPRGIALDEDGIRYLQACGLYSKIFTEIGQCMGNFRFIGGKHRDLSSKPFMTMDYNTTEGGTGHPGFMCHKQPHVERCLRAHIDRLGVADVRLGSCVTHIEEDEEWVYVTYSDNQGAKRTTRASFLVGADGKTGFTRKQYLEPRGIAMERLVTAAYEKEWVALNWRISLPTPATHPEFPLWAKGYTPEQVYDAFFPTDFRFLCNPDRASVCGRFGLKNDRLWRFEFVVLGGEDSTEMATPPQIAKVVHPYITHAGSKYGLPHKSIGYPADCIEVLRCRPFRFSANSCNKWSLGRVVLCGDAAHVFPPFGGQGIASGFRDAISLAWRLFIATRLPPNSKAMDHETLLEGWYSERKQQLNESLASTVKNGAYVSEGNIIRVFLRDWYLWLVQLVPSWRHTLSLGIRSEGLVKYKWEGGKGMAFLPQFSGGSNFPQVYAVQVGNRPTGQKVVFTDDLIFRPGKKGLFQAIVIASSKETAFQLDITKQALEEKSGGLLREDEVTVFLNQTSDLTFSTPNRNIYRFATAAEFATDPKLCGGRPEPIGYDPHRMVREVGTDKIIILRPDRFVFAVCSTKADLLDATEKLRTLGETGKLEILPNAEHQIVSV